MSPQLAYWEPEDRLFWAREGAQVARRNLLLSIPPLVLSFAVWMLWSVVVVELPRIGFRFSANQLFWLAALPGLAGALLRLFFSFLVPVFGGRTWTTLSTAALLVPAIGLGLAVQDPGTGYPTFLALALAAGIGGGNFASSMANVSFFYPLDRKGAALGWNAGLGNLGVGLAQIVVPLVVGAGLFGALGGPALVLARRRGHARDLAAERRLRLGAAHRGGGARRVVRHGRSRHREGVVRNPGRDLHAQAQLDPLVALPRNVRLVHRLCRRLPAGGRDGIRRRPKRSPTPSSGRCSARSPARVGGYLADRYGGARIALAAFGAMALVVAAMLVARVQSAAHPAMRRSSCCSRCCSSRAARATAPSSR